MLGFIFSTTLKTKFFDTFPFCFVLQNQEFITHSYQNKFSHIPKLIFNPIFFFAWLWVYFSKVISIIRIELFKIVKAINIFIPILNRVFIVMLSIQNSHDKDQHYSKYGLNNLHSYHPQEAYHPSPQGYQTIHICDDEHTRFHLL